MPQVWGVFFPSQHYVLTHMPHRASLELDSDLKLKRYTIKLREFVLVHYYIGYSRVFRYLITKILVYQLYQLNRYLKLQSQECRRK